VVTLVVCPVVLLVKKTLAPLMTPPLVEETVPVMVVVAVSWATAAAIKYTKSRKNKPSLSGHRRIKHKFPDTILMGNFLIHLRIEIFGA
jgi:hypothetical protein